MSQLASRSKLIALLPWGLWLSLFLHCSQYIFRCYLEKSFDVIVINHDRNIVSYFWVIPMTDSNWVPIFRALLKLFLSKIVCVFICHHLLWYAVVVSHRDLHSDQFYSQCTFRQSPVSSNHLASISNNTPRTPNYAYGGLSPPLEWQWKKLNQGLRRRSTALVHS